VIVTWSTPPVLSNSFVIFPEAFALLATAWCLQTASVDAKRWSAVEGFLLTATLGWLPWFHRKYALYAGALLVALLWQSRRSVNGLTLAQQLAMSAMFIAPQVALAAWTWHHWGNLAGPLSMMEDPPFSLGAFRTGIFGVLIDRENGLLVWAPVYAVVAAAWMLAGRRYAALLLPTVTLVLMSAAHTQWWGGFSPAARFLMPLVPIFVSVGAAAWNHRVFRLTCVTLLIPQLIIAADGWQHTR